MSWHFIAILAVVVVYIANILGCLVLCETIPELAPARKYAWYVPILIFLFPIYVVLAPSIKNKFELIWGFIRMPHKSITAISSVVYSMKEQEFKRTQYDPFHQKPSLQRQRANVLADSAAHYGAAIFTGWFN